MGKGNKDNKDKTKNKDKKKLTTKEKKKIKEEKKNNKQVKLHDLPNKSFAGNVGQYFKQSCYLTTTDLVFFRFPLFVQY